MDGDLQSTFTKTLLERCNLKKDALDNARYESREKGQPLEEVLLEKGLISQSDMVLSMGSYLGINPFSLENFSVDATLFNLLPSDEWQDLSMIPVARSSQMLTVATSDPFDHFKFDEVSNKLGMTVVPVIVSSDELQAVLSENVQESGQDLDEILKDIADGNELEISETEEGATDLGQITEEAGDAPVVRITNSILIEALRKGASDIHIEPMEKKIRLRYRIDGVLYPSPSPPKSVKYALVSRIKIMSNLDIAERRIPQDGRFKIQALGKEVDVRVSILPTVHGEKTVMRILDKSSLAPDLSHLGLDKEPFEKLNYAIGQPYGMILVTGPTGSGKTTTLYSALQELNESDVNIITVEDPVEYQLGGINQVQTNAAVDLTFASGLRSILRQDPDVVMVGEIRDEETAGIAVQAALTGHLVLSTLHTNSAPGAVARLAYMGVEPFMLSSALLMAQAQRLYRKLCPVCRQQIEVSEETLRLNRIDPDQLPERTCYVAKGCPKCSDIGYKGRGAIMEIMLADEKIKRKMLETTETTVIKEVAEASGMATLRDVGLQKVRDGESSLEEILRVTSE